MPVQIVARESLHDGRPLIRIICPTYGTIGGCKSCISRRVFWALRKYREPGQIDSLTLSADAVQPVRVKGFTSKESTDTELLAAIISSSSGIAAPASGSFAARSRRHLIELNPMRAGMVSQHAVHKNLGDRDSTRRKRYRRLFESKLDRDLMDDIRGATNACRVLGSEAFTDQIEAMLGRRVRPDRIGRSRRESGV